MAAEDSSIERARRSHKNWDNIDWPAQAALSIMENCNGRRGLHMDDIDQDTQNEIADSFAEIIRQCFNAQ